ncbi:MAG: hypothetical protein IPO83_18020 [Chitinophagaceae bacterium]|nr:hypothetical protein [Chitinophagaceae bacterium]
MNSPLQVLQLNHSVYFENRILNGPSDLNIFSTICIKHNETDQIFKIEIQQVNAGYLENQENISPDKRYLLVYKISNIIDSGSHLTWSILVLDLQTNSFIGFQTKEQIAVTNDNFIEWVDTLPHVIKISTQEAGKFEYAEPTK